VWNQTNFFQNSAQLLDAFQNSVIRTAKCEDDGKLRAGNFEQPAQRLKRKKKEQTKSRPKREAGNVDSSKLPPVGTYDMMGGTINMISNQMMMSSDSFEMSLTNVIADDGNMMMGVQGESYFTVRHSLTMDGPLTYLMSGGQGSGREYTVEAIAARAKHYTCVANWTPSMGTLDGQWEQHYTNNLSSMFQFAVTGSDDRRLAMMLPNFSGKFTYANSLRNWTAGKSQQGSFYISTLNRILPYFSLGSKFTYKEDGNTALSLGGQYTIRGSTPFEKEVIEFRSSAQALTAMYTRQLSRHATLATKFDLAYGSKQASSSLFYKYMFGSEASGTQILGEIDSKFTCKCIFMMPFLQRFMLKINGEMNHFDCNVKMGQVQHKFGFNIMVQF